MAKFTTSPQMIRYEIIDPIRPRKTPRWSKWHVVLNDANVTKTACGSWIALDGPAHIQKANLSDIDASDVCQKCIHPSLLE